MDALPRRQPAEWEPHSGCWLAYPRLPEEWPGAFEAAQQEVIQLCRAIADVNPITGLPQGETVHLLVHPTVATAAKAALVDVPIEFHGLPYDDIWLRDTGLVFAIAADGSPVGVRFQFNAWGGKFEFPNDAQLADAILKEQGIVIERSPLVIEGGAIETDGQGTCLTTRPCLISEARNPGYSQAEIEAQLKKLLGYEKILWLDQGLENDHTDGHIDTLARFIAPGVVACMLPSDRQDPNGPVLRQIADTLVAMTDAQGRSLQIVTVPSPGLIQGANGVPLPASYLNFYIGNSTVVVPTYGVDQDEVAVRAIAAFFPTRRTVGVSARGLITGGGAFHCITQQQPIKREFDQ